MRSRIGRFWWVSLLTFFFVAGSTLKFAVAQFPCDLNELRKLNSGRLPELYLSGENHYNFYCKVDRYVHEQFAREGKLDIAREGALFGELGEGQHGIEDPLVFALTNIADSFSEIHFHDLVAVAKALNSETKDRNIELTDHFENFFENHLPGNRFLSESWSRLRTKQKENGTVASAGEQSIAKIIDSFLATPEESRPDLMKLIHALKLEDEVKELKNLLGRFCNAFVRDYNESYFKNTDLLALTPVDPDKLRNGDLDYKRSIMLNLRNEVFARNLAKVYCLAAREKKSVFAVIGQNHIEGLVPIFNQLSGGVIPLVSRDSKQACHNLFHGATGEVARTLEGQYGQCFSKVGTSLVADQYIMDLAEYMGQVYQAGGETALTQSIPPGALKIKRPKKSNCKLKCGNGICDVICSWFRF